MTDGQTMNSTRIHLPGGQRSWTVVDSEGYVVQVIRDWVIHLEETHTSPNTIKAYVRHIARLGSYLNAHQCDFRDITIPSYDRFLQWVPWAIRQTAACTDNILVFNRQPSLQLSASIRNQIHLAVKAFYRYLLNRDEFEIAVSDKPTRYAGHQAYKSFLEHLNQRKTTKQKDRYLQGDLSRYRKKISDYRLTPEEVLALIQQCHLMRDAFLIVLLYNTGMRIGEALGLRHDDMDVTQNIVWIVPRDDNENGAHAKSNRTRPIPVHADVTHMYEDFITSDEYAAAFESGTPYVFCNVKHGAIGRALSLSYANKLQCLLEQRSKITFNWHMFRHTHASEAIADGYSLLEIADRLGHVSPQTTVDFYRHLFSAEVRKLFLTGPKRLHTRLEELRDARLFGKDLRWL